ncbi:EboA domain-containing protein [Adhaeribacter aquaticus]|uniref:EboA domain-containing protein n=1 Tax=Adhaeribacter aquaticus TaxID=299567 RepID=UPI00041017F2|nr:EboA domain-containing protein [Adhaeribacter aquaticus]
MSAEAYKQFLSGLVQTQLPPQGQNWLEKQLNQIKSEKEFYLAFSMAPRFTGKKQLILTEEELQQATQLREGFNPNNWTVDQVARTLLVLAIPHQTPEQFIAILNKIFSTADLGELTALYAALPLLPYQELHVKRAAEGVRTTMTQVFDAIALNNPYPHDYLPEEAWNQMVLKSVFNVRPLYQIYGLDARRNETLARIAIDYAHERWSANRTLTPELWRLVAPFINGNNLADVQRLLKSSEQIQLHAAALALTESNLPEAQHILAQYPEIVKGIQEGKITWNLIGKQSYS